MTAERWLLMDATCLGELHLALTDPGEPGLIDKIVCYRAEELPTLTDALLRFQREAGISLLGVTAALAVAGAVTSDTITIARSRWVISRSGLATLFGKPVAIVNDVAARAWAMFGGVDVRLRLRGLRNPDITAPGRSVLLTFHDGVGAAAIDVDQAGRVTVIDSEAGHLDFVPANAAEERLHRSLTAIGENPSWEQVLMAAFTDASPIDDPDMAAHLAGRFAGTTVLGFGAWRGVMITGRNAEKLTSPAAIAAFSNTFCFRRRFRRELNATPCWIVDEGEAVFAGLKIGRAHV